MTHGPSRAALGRAHHLSFTDVRTANRLPTLGDVAELAGVSRSTVSNVIRGSSVVAPRTRRRVQAAVDQLGYRPNALARQLLAGRAQLIGIVAHQLTNPFFADIATIAEREIARCGFGTMLYTTQDDRESEGNAVSLMLENRVSGVVFLSYLDDAAEIGRRVSGQVATMFIGATEAWSDSVAVDERRGGELVARHLLDLGHRRVAFICPTHPDPADLERLDGFRRLVEDAGGSLLSLQWDAPHGRPQSGGHEVSWSDVMTGPDRVTGIFASNDFTAIDTLDVADALEVRVPEELSIVGFDDVSFAALRRINLTTVHQPRRELVRLGVEGLVGRIAGRIAGPPRVTLASVDLRIRGTTGPAGP